jgi:hypothetical protein
MARKSFKDVLRDNDAAQRGWAAMYGKPVNPEFMNNVADAKPRAPRQASTIPSEHEEQKAVVAWWGLQGKAWGYPRNALFAIPNAQALIKFADNPNAFLTYLKVEGMRDGMLDLMLAVPANGRHGLFIEMKRSKGGVVSDEQSANVEMFTRLGYDASVRHGAEAGIAAIKTYLGRANET